MMRQGMTRFVSVVCVLAMATMSSAQQGKDIRPYMAKSKGEKTPPPAKPEPRIGAAKNDYVPAPRQAAPPMMPKANHSPAPAAAPAHSTPVQVQSQTHSSGQMQLMQESSIPAASNPPPRVIHSSPSPVVQVVSTPPPAAPVQSTSFTQATPVVRSAGSNRTETFYPGGDRSSSALMLERTLPGEVRVGEAYQYEIKLTNLTGQEIRELELSEQMPSAFKMTGTTPKASGGETHWSLGALAPHQSTSIQVNGSATSTGELKYCATVAFKTEVCATNRIVQPALQLTVTAPAEVILCDPIPLKYVVTNTGNGVARNVKVTHALASGLTADGRSELTFDAGDLGEKQSREFTATVKAAAVGSYAHKAAAREDGGLTADASADTKVTVPKFALTKTGPDVRYIGRPATYEITITNQGDAVAKDTVIMDDVSAAGSKVTEASQGGQISGDKVIWNIGALAIGATQKVSLTVVPTQIGIIKNTVVAKAYCAEASASAETKALGIPAILLEVVDNDDPIEVGSQEHYDIIVTNQGSADGTNINITATIPAEQEYVNATGPTQAQAQGKTVTFAPLPMLAPHAKATFRVTVKGTTMADVRFKVSMTSDQAKVPVEETESTHIYQ